ncbi:MAG: hypothetical protein ACOH2F_15000 [Cellulomonas sp.]
MRSRAAVIELCRSRERVALERLAAAAAGRSMCSLSRAGASVPAAKYHEGAAAALGEARRAVAALPTSADEAPAVRAALLDVGARWRGESGTPGRSGPGWTGYLAGGIDALDLMIDDDDDEGRDEVPRTDREREEAVRVRPDLPVLDDLAAAGAGPGADVVGLDRPATSGRFDRVRSRWPARRIAAVAVLTPALTALLVAASGGWETAIPGGWTALVALIAVTSATTLATYLPLPGTGRRLDVGCTPCASVAALSVVIAGFVLLSTPHDLPTAILAAGVAAFGLRQRWANPSSCAA